MEILKYVLFTIAMICMTIKVGTTAHGRNPCKGKEEGALFPDPKTCHGFIKCSFGRPYEQTCPTKLMYNPSHRSCDYANNVQCPGNRCKTNNGGCAYKCVYIDNNSYGCVCKSGFKIDTNQKTCIRGSLNMDSYCDEIQHGQTLPHPTNCKEYVQCVGSQSHPRKCPAGLVFDPKNKGCDWNRPGLCQDADFTTWSSWSNCFMTSKDGCLRKRIRECKEGGKLCKGFNSEVKRCDEASCKKDQCGIAPLRNDDIIAHIVAGQDTLRGGYPWQAAIYVVSAENKQEFHCAGTLIGKRTVISAAHCFSDPQRGAQVNGYKLVLGEFDRNKKEGSEKTVGIKEIKVHEYYNKYTYTHDIALIKLTEDVQYSNYISPACLPPKNEELKVDTSCRVTGWGRISGTTSKSADKLQEITLPVVDEKVCRTTNVLENKRVTSTMICAGFTNGKNFESACHGDSGGPLSCMSDDGTWKVYGVVSWGDPQCEFGSYNVFTKVSKYIDWINKDTDGQPKEDVNPEP